MKKRLLACLLCLMLLCTSGLTPACAEGEANNAADRVQALIGGIVAYHLERTGAENVQAWIDGDLAQNAGMGSEWYVFALSQSGAYDFSAYRESLLRYLEGTGVLSASTRQKYTLALIAAGGGDPFIASTLQETIGKQGIMSWVYGLHLLSNGYEGAVTAGEAVAHLLSLQLEDGGWALSGTVSDVDVTAMTLQALAPHASETAVGEAIEKAIALLSQRQLETGDYASYGVPNPESTAQVLVALCELGIDGLQDERFIKNGSTLLDGISRYRLEDGSFSHTLGGEVNTTATVQAFYSLLAYQRMLDGRGSLYLLDRQSEPAAAERSEALTGLGYKPTAAGVIAAAALSACLVLLIMGKRSRKNFLFVLIFAAALIAFVFFTDFQTADQYYTGVTIVKENPVGKVTLTIRCDTVAGKTDADYIPEDGVMLSETSFDIVEGETVYNLLTQAAQTCGIRLDSSGSQGMVYIAGINHLYEFAFGDLSGWMYFVNGESPTVGCDQYVLADGDAIEWLYTCNLGSDLK